MHMDLTALNIFQLYDHFINMNNAYIKAMERDKLAIMDKDSLDSVKVQLHEAINELRRRRQSNHIVSDQSQSLPATKLY